MIWFSKKLSKKFALDISLLHSIRRFEDGISFIEFKINLDLFKGDHNPKLDIIFILLNFKVFEVEIYNEEHINEE